MDDPVGAAFLAEARRSFRSSKTLAEAALDQVDDGDFFRSPAPDSNSIAVIVQHLAGNMKSRFTEFLTSDGEKPNRNRDQEFEIGPSATRAEVLKNWHAGWKIVFEALEACVPSDVLRTVMIRGEAHTVLEALSRQQTHYAQHIGQIIVLAKQFRGSGWTSLSIPRGQSEEFNRLAWGGRRTPR